MAVGHYRKKQNKRNQSDSDVTLPRSAHAASLSISAKSSDLESDGVKCSEMLDGTNGRPAFTLESSEKSTGPIVSRPSAITDEDVAIAPTISTSTKASRKKMTKKQKSASAVPKSTPTSNATTASSSEVSSAGPMQQEMSLKNSHDDALIPDGTATTLQEGSQGFEPNSTKSTLPATKVTHKKHKYSKSERKAHKLMLALANPNKSSTSPAVQVELTDNVATTPNADLESTSAPSSSSHDTTPIVSTDSQAANPSTKKSLHATEKNDNQGGSNAPLPTTTKKHKKTKSKYVLPSITPDTVSSKGATSHEASRNKSLDVRINLNGSSHRLLTVQEMPRMDSTLAEQDVDSKIKIKLPGRKATTVWSEDLSRASSALGRTRSHHTSVSSQRSSSSHKSTQDMRSRQSSHTTVMTHNALENKLQSMILSHTHSMSNTPMTASVSTISEPATGRISRVSSPHTKLKTLRSAPPDTGFIPDSKPGLDNVSSTTYDSIKRGPISMSKQADDMPVAIPAVPTLFESRASQVQAPPFLGPPQVQNVPEHIPTPYSQGPYAQNYAHPNQSYNSRQMGSIPYNNNFYTPPMYSPGFVPQMMPSGIPMQAMFENYGPPNGMVYYDQDGMPIYPPHPYEQQYYTPQYNGYY